ncbi:sensor histidine kinase [Faecalibacterium gallinarum]|uniref:histidine kinase n=1 Tax=Faecalibacterium gallinarum TaxID=2903556 RepID=A0AA37MWK5_9FIRM|nr:ATP-binding protein [Faecalibacterium gallinarum]GJN64081.1 hypothetical protein JCM17207_07060 [Faecalibacterium gallinarum]
MKMRSMEEKIGYRLFMMGFLGLVCTAVLCIFVFHKAFIEQAWQSLEYQTALIAAIYQDNPQNLENISPQEIRLTLISPDGDVLYETATDQQTMENHIGRPEIQEALESGVGQDIRDSQTMGYQTYYYAQRLSDGNILRIAQDSQSLWSIYDEALPAILLSCLLMMGIAAITAGILTRTLIQPVLKMTEDLDHIQENVPYRELAPFAEAIHSDRVLRENNEKMRQEFTANVSHELKTPLTSISGYAELIETGMAKPEDVAEFGSKIHREASRMIRLVNDILQLSHLDSVRPEGEAVTMETVDLLELARDCVERQKVNARHAYVALSYLGESAPVLGSRTLLEELYQNLCDNAIRYNRPGGKVQLAVGCTRDGHAYLTVRDNGIGIPKDAQSSVFERFYRVDKSRSKATGGTGLGLAIVKNIARIHNARIKLESEVGVGTTITVTFELAH